MTRPVHYGNTYDKYGTSHPLEAWLVRRHLAALTALLRRAAPASVLEVGCGEGGLAQRLLEGPLQPGTRYLATDLFARELPRPRHSRIRSAAMDAGRLAVRPRSVDLVLLLEVLEHLPDPDRALAEAARAARGHVLISVPWEPLWRVGNLVRGRYWSALGNTPGHIQHFSRSRIRALVARHLRVVEERQPLPWTVLLARGTD